MPFFVSFDKKSQEVIIKVKLGLLGIGLVVFRSEEEILDEATGDRPKYYDEIIAPYKGKLEEWFVEHRNLYTYFMLIFLTIWVVLFPKSKLHFKVFKDLPKPPKELEGKL